MCILEGRIHSVHFRGMDTQYEFVHLKWYIHSANFRGMVIHSVHLKRWIHLE